MKKIFMASLVAMMAVTAANAQIASTEYTDATFVAKDGFDALVAATPQVTANKEDIKTIKEGPVVQVGINQADIATINNSDVMKSGVKAATVTQVATNASDIAALQVGKLAKNQTAANAGKAMVTDGNGDVVPGLIIEGMISGNAVTTAKIADDAVTTAKIAGNAVILDHLNSEVKAVLGDGVNAMEAIGRMNSETTGTGTVVKSVTQTEGKVAVGLGYIGTDDITDGAVTTAKIQDRAVGGAKIADSGVVTRNIADDAIVTSKILNANVTTAKIADNAVTTAKIADANVTTAKIADANVTKAKLDASVKATLDKADNAMQESGLKTLQSWTDQKCDTQGVTCSLVSKSGVIAWEAVKY